MPIITDSGLALWYGAVYFIAIVGAWVATTVVLLVVRRWRRLARRAGARPEHPDPADDPELHRFFAKVNRAYRRRPPAHVEAPLPSVPLRAAIPARPPYAPETPVIEPPVNAGQAIPDSTVLHSAPFHSPRPAKSLSALTATKPLRSPDRLQVPAQGPAQDDLVALAKLWPRLSPKDRRELLALARIKAGVEG